LLGATPAHADATCPPGTFPPPGPIAIINPGDDISCFNVYDRSNAGNVIDLETNAANEFINLYNSGILTGASGASAVSAIFTYRGQVNSPITIENVASVAATSKMPMASPPSRRSAAPAVPSASKTAGIAANSTAGTGDGIVVQTNGDASPFSIVNSADIKRHWPHVFQRHPRVERWRQQPC
jgi:hypothetical protein